MGESPLDYYFNTALEKLILGAWEWKHGRDLSEQLIRIVDSQITKEVKKVTTKKYQNFEIKYQDIESTFYNLGEIPEDIEAKEADYEYKLKLIKDAIVDDDELIEFLEAIKPEFKPAEIAELLGKTTKQLGKIKERLLRKVRSHVYHLQRK